MTSSRPLRRGDVVFVPFRFVDKDAAKNRPAVVISSDRYHRSRHELVIGGVTSNVSRAGFVGQFSIDNWAGCGLEKPSVVSGIVMTIRDTQVGRYLGSFSRADMLSLDAALKESLAL